MPSAGGTTTSTAPAPAAPVALPSFGEAVRVWARIGLLSFGGPAGQIATMHRELVEERGWISETRFLHALNYCMLLPGPEAQQLATYVGWLLHRTLGGLVAGLLFILPGAVVMSALGMLYAVSHDVPLISALFFGIKAAVLAVVVQALLRIGRRALSTRLHLAIAALAFVAIYAAQVPFPLVVLAAGLFGFAFAGKGFGAPAAPAAGEGIVDDLFAQGAMAHTRPSAGRALKGLAVWLPAWLGPVALLALLTGLHSVWTTIGSFFSVMAVVTFGGAYAALAYVAQAAVETFGWLSPHEMVDGLGLAETTPGPLILVLQFVGILAAYRDPGALPAWLAGLLGGVLTVWVTFAPCFLWIFLGAPYMEALRGNRRLAAAMSAITAAVVGVILNLAVWFALHVVFREVREWRVLGLSPDVPVLASVDWRAAVLAVGALVAMLRFRAGMMATLGVCALAGLALSWLPA